MIDANDNNPTFENYTYDVRVPENSPVGMILLRVHATDPDTGNIISFYFSICTLSNRGYSFVASHTGVLFKINKKRT